VNAKLLFLA